MKRLIDPAETENRNWTEQWQLTGEEVSANEVPGFSQTKVLFMIESAFI